MSTGIYSFVGMAVVNLRTGKFIRDPQGELFLKSSWVEYDSKATCPRWLQFLDGVFKNDEEVISFIQRAVGCTLTGDVREDCLFIWCLHGLKNDSLGCQDAFILRDLPEVRKIPREEA